MGTATLRLTWLRVADADREVPEPRHFPGPLPPTATGACRRKERLLERWRSRGRPTPAPPGPDRAIDVFRSPCANVLLTEAWQARVWIRMIVGCAQVPLDTSNRAIAVGSFFMIPGLLDKALARKGLTAHDPRGRAPTGFLCRCDVGSAQP